MFEITLSDNPFYYDIRYEGLPFLVGKFHGKKIIFTDKPISLDDMEVLIKEIKQFMDGENYIE